MSAAPTKPVNADPTDIPVELPDDLALLVGRAFAIAPTDGHASRRILKLAAQRVKARRARDAEAVKRIEGHMADVAREVVPATIKPAQQPVDWRPMDWSSGIHGFLEGAKDAFLESVHCAQLANPHISASPRSKSGQPRGSFRAWDIHLRFRLCPGSCLHVWASTSDRTAPRSQQTYEWPNGAHTPHELGKWWMQTHGVTALVLLSSPVVTHRTGSA